MTHIKKHWLVDLYGSLNTDGTFMHLGYWEMDKDAH